MKLCDLAMLGHDSLIIVERVSAPAKLYLVSLDPARALGPFWTDRATRPRIEIQSADNTLDLPVLNKQLLSSTDNHPAINPDLEELVLLEGPRILLVNDNDFGVGGARTRFCRVEFATSFEAA